MNVGLQLQSSGSAFNLAKIASRPQSLTVIERFSTRLSISASSSSFTRTCTLLLRFAAFGRAFLPGVLFFTATMAIMYQL